MQKIELIQFFLLIIMLLAVIFLIFRYLWVKNSALREFTIKLCLLIFTFTLFMMPVEYYFATRYIVSDGFAFTLATRLWFKKYWYPVNSFGYRDAEHFRFKGKKVLFIVGDSFVAGHGIKNVADRFTNILAKMMGDQWETVMIAQIDWDTNDELSAVTAYPRKPDAIILSYYINDIDGTIARLADASLPRPPIVVPNKYIRPIVDNSYFFNALYWRYYRSANLGLPYWEYLQKSYKNPLVFDEHARELYNFIDYAKLNKIPLAVMVWPSLVQIEQSREYTKRVVELFKNEKIPVLDLYQIFTNRKPKELIVNSLDAHPNEAVHHEVATLLYDKFNDYLNHN